jgi:hypothetical protein
MVEPESTRGAPAVNPDDFEQSILQFVEAGLAVAARPDLGAIELALRDHGETVETIVLAPAQALVLAQRLFAAVLRLAAEGRP